MKELKAYMDQNGYEAFRNINTKGVNIDTVSNHLNQNQFFPFNNFITALSFSSKEDMNSTEKCEASGQPSRCVMEGRHNKKHRM